MQSNSADTTPTKKATIVVEEYARMETGGWIALGLGIIGAAVLLTVGVATHTVLPTGTAALTMGLYLSGCIFLVGRLVLRKLDLARTELEDHKADHEVAQIDTQDIAAIKNDVAKILSFMARRELEDQQVAKLVEQVEEWLAWKAAAERRLTLLEGDNVIDIETVRAVNEVRKHLPKHDD